MRKAQGSDAMKEYRTDEQKKEFYNSTDWNELRTQALERDNYECQECKRLGYVSLDSVKEPGKKKPIKLNVHHIKEIEDFPELAMELDNLSTICLYHHNLVHGRVWDKKSNKWEDDELEIL